MQHTTDTQPEADARLADRSTGTEPQPTTAPGWDSLLTEHARACVLYLDAARDRYLAEARQRRAAAAAALLNPLTSHRKGHETAAVYESRARLAEKAAAGYAARADKMRKFNPELRIEPRIRLTAEIFRNRVNRTATYESSDARHVLDSAPSFSELWAWDRGAWILTAWIAEATDSALHRAPANEGGSAEGMPNIGSVLRSALDAWPLPTALADLWPMAGGRDDA